MGCPFTSADLEDLRELIRYGQDDHGERLKDIQATLKAQNGRLGSTEVKVAVLEERSKSWLVKSTPWVGGTALIGAIAELLSHFFITTPVGK